MKFTILKKYKPAIQVYIITTDTIFSNDLLLKLEEETDYDVFQNSTGEEFLQDIVQTPFPPTVIPVIILDYNLKSIEYQNANDGLHILKEIKQYYPHWEIITMSDMSMMKIKDEAIALGASTHVSKNINTFVRVKTRIHEIENECYLKFQKRMFFYSIIILVGLLILLFLFRIIFSVVE